MTMGSGEMHIFPTFRPSSHQRNEKGSTEDLGAGSCKPGQSLNSSVPKGPILTVALKLDLAGLLQGPNEKMRTERIIGIPF